MKGRIRIRRGVEKEEPMGTREDGKGKGLWEWEEEQDKENGKGSERKGK